MDRSGEYTTQEHYVGAALSCQLNLFGNISQPLYKIIVRLQIIISSEIEAMVQVPHICIVHD